MISAESNHSNEQQENPQYLKAAKLCLTCGAYFHKSFLPSHTKQCLKRQMIEQGINNNRNYNNINPAIEKQSVSFDLQPALPCANCHKSIPQEKLENHLRVCGITRVSSPPPVTTNHNQDNEMSSLASKLESQTLNNPVNIFKPTNMQFKYEEPQNLDQPEDSYEEDFENENMNESNDIEDENHEQSDNNLTVEEKPTQNEYPSQKSQRVLVGKEYITERPTTAEAVDTRVKCDICERKFNPDSYERHITGCKKLAARKGKVFDTAKKRAEGTDLEKFTKLKGVLDDKLQSKSKKPTTPKLVHAADETVIPTLHRQGNEKDSQFSKSLKIAKTLRKIENNGEVEIHVPVEKNSREKSSPIIQKQKFSARVPQIDSTTCFYCERKFSQEASERHVPICRALFEKSKYKSGSASTKSSPKLSRATTGNMKDRDGYGYAKDSASGIMTKKNELDMALKRRTQFQPPVPTQRRQSIASAAASLGKLTELSGSAATFCTDCGSMFATAKARFCVECGNHR